MKKIILFFFIFLPLLAIGQLYTTMADAKFQPLNKNAITTDILYDRVYPMAELTDFNQIAIDTSQVHHFYNAYAELQTADYTSRWSSITSLRTQVATQWQQNKIALGIINTDFEVIDDEALDDNLLIFSMPDSLLVDVANRPRSPYIKRNAFVVSPLQENSNSTTVTFVTSSNFTMQAANTTIASLQADFGNGQGYQNVSLNGSKTVSFSSTGLYYIKFKVNFSNGTTRYTYGKIRINSEPYVAFKSAVATKAGSSSCTSGTIFSSRKFQGYDEPQAYEGAGEFQVLQGGSALDKPVIVLDGFDAFEGEENGVDVVEILDFLDYETGNLSTDLTTNDFDIIPLNFIKYVADDGRTINGGTDYVERNAMVLVDLITKMRSCKTGGFPIKIIGFSMGGLVGRYALRYMEQNGIPHDTDLFISVDTPHKGATVPVGIQEIADLIDDIVPFGLGNAADDLLLTPAARQLLVHHFLAGSKTAAGAPNFHDRFYNDLDAMGFPVQTRNISVVNGVSTGDAINTAGQRYLNGEIETGLGFLKIGGRIKASLNYAPNRGQTKDVMNFKIQLKLLLIRINLFKRIKQVTTSSAIGSYENSPGGFFDVEDLASEFLGADLEFDLFNNDFLNAVIGEVKASLTDPNFSFIPVKSSLAYSGSNQDLYEDFSPRDLVCAGDTPFDSYFTSATNDKHISLNSNSANFIEQEILGVQQSPNISIDNADIINGDDYLCINTNKTYTLEGCTAPSVTWTSSSNLTIVSSNVTGITVRSSTSSSGSAFIRATYQGITTQKNIWIGKPTLSSSNINGSTTISNCNSTYIYKYMGGVGGAESTRWVVASQFDDVSTGNNKTLYVDPINKGNGYVTFVASNPCGEAILCKPVNVNSSNCGFGSINFPTQYACGDSGFDPFGNGSFFIVSPNPANSNINVSSIETNQKTTQGSGYNKNTLNATDGKTILQLYNFTGTLVKSIDNGATSINVSSLRKGIYFLRIVSEKHNEIHQIIIE